MSTKPPPSPFDERRAHQRVELLAQVQISRADEVHIMSTVNLSHGGVFLSGSPAELPQLRVGTEAELVIFAPDDVGEDVDVKGRIVRVERLARPGCPTGFAIEFVRLDKANQARLRSILAR